MHSTTEISKDTQLKQDKVLILDLMQRNGELVEALDRAINLIEDDEVRDELESVSNKPFNYKWSRCSLIDSIVNAAVDGNADTAVKLAKELTDWLPAWHGERQRRNEKAVNARKAREANADA